LFHLELLLRLAGDMAGKRILYLGCGDEPSTVLLALRGAEVWAVDVSLPALHRQRRMAAVNEVPERIRPIAGAAERLPFGGQSFDLVWGVGILHHLQEDLDAACAEILRVLAQDGFALFYEPVLRSALVRRVRALFPAGVDASPRCRPLSTESMRCLHRHFNVESHPFMFLSRFNRYFVPLGTRLEFAVPWRAWACLALHFLDYLVFRVPRLAGLAGGNVVKLTVPASTALEAAPGPLMPGGLLPARDPGSAQLPSEVGHVAADRLIEGCQLRPSGRERRDSSVVASLHLVAKFSGLLTLPRRRTWRSEARGVGPRRS